jgi:hypothetical protein
MLFFLEEGKFHNFWKIIQLNGPLYKKKPSKYMPTTNSHNFARNSAPTYKAIIISLEPCALNADFQHLNPRFNKISLFYGYP